VLIWYIVPYELELEYQSSAHPTEEEEPVGEIYLFVETDQFIRNYGSVVVATVATACSGS